MRVLRMTTKRGADLLRDPRWNRGTAFTEEERDRLGLLGLLPEGVDTLETQLRRVLDQLDEKKTDLERYIFLSHLLDLSETVFYALLMSDPARFLPLVYTPTVGEACRSFAHILRHTRGMYLSIQRRGHVREVLRNWPEHDVRFIVVTSGRDSRTRRPGRERHGHPDRQARALHRMRRGPAQFTLPSSSTAAPTTRPCCATRSTWACARRVRKSRSWTSSWKNSSPPSQDEFPNCCIQFEDWAGVDAIRLLARYRDRICCFNDDIQGTAAVALAGILGALRITGGKLSEQTLPVPWRRFGGHRHRGPA